MRYLVIFCLILIHSLVLSTEELQKVLDSNLSTFKLPSLSAAYIVDGKIKEIASSGIRKVGFPDKVTTNDNFNLGSCTKAMTATLVAKLVEKNILRWDTTIGESLSSYKIHKSLRKITIQQLLSHTSGLPANLEGLKDPKIRQIVWSGSQTNTETRSLVINHILEDDKLFKPETKFYYSNLNYIIVGHILEILAKESFEKLMQTNIFDELHMKSCKFGITSNPQNLSRPPENVWGHYISKGETIPIHKGNPSIYSPAGNLNCTIQDWSKFLSEHIKGYHGRSDLLSKKSFENLHKIAPQTTKSYTNGGWFKYQKDWADGDVLNHTGSNTFNFANVWVAPKQNAIIISTSNLMKDAYTATNNVIWNIIQRNIE